MTTIIRRQLHDEALDPDRFLLRFAASHHGPAVTVDPTDCPRNIHARSHWRLTGRDADGYTVECRCDESESA